MHAVHVQHAFWLMSVSCILGQAALLLPQSAAPDARRLLCSRWT